MIIRAQVSWAADLPDVKHRMCITPHFKLLDTGGIFNAENPQAIADDLCTAMNTWAGTSRETNVKLYDAEAPAPSYPIAEKTLALGSIPVSNGPRELAICLSYRCGDGPRYRGRLYIPAVLCGSAGYGLRPSVGQRQKAADLAPLLRNLGGADVDWGVWSRVDREFRETLTAHVDDEWDVIRSRGLSPTTTTKRGRRVVDSARWRSSPPIWPPLSRS